MLMFPKVLFVSHSATLTGAPLVLYHLASWLKRERLCDFEVLIRNDGPMVQKFAELGPTRILPPDADSDISCSTPWLRRIWAHRAFPSKVAQYKLLRELKAQKFDLIYANTITLGNHLDWLAPLGCPVVTHVHELEHWIKASGELNLEQVKRHTHYYIAASRAVRDNLIGRHGFDPAAIGVVHEFIPVAAAAHVEHDRIALRNQLALPLERAIVVGSGHETWRKGKDLFVELCREVKMRKPEAPAFFLWVGGWESDHHRHEIEKLAAQYCLGENIRFVGAVVNPLEYFAASDFFAMVSREDPFPLVCLEAAACGKPILCFADAGGIPEFVEKDAGIVVPFCDVSAMASRLIYLINSPAVVHEMGFCAEEKVRVRHDRSVGGRQVLEVIERVIARGANRKRDAHTPMHNV